MAPAKKQRLDGFHESYFDHSCTVVNKKDVLTTDIRDSFGSSFRRWWCGLFLVSYGDERASLYYTSSEAMRLDRIRQFRHFRGRIHPLSKFRTFWDSWMLILVIVNSIMVHHNLSITHGQVSFYFYVVGPIIEVFLMLDVFINAKSGYIDHNARRIVMEGSAGIIHYCSTKLFLHVASAIPIQSILFLRYGVKVDCDLCKTNYFIFTLRFITVFGLLRCYEYSVHWTREWDSFEVTSAFRFLRVFVMGILTLLYLQDIAAKVNLMIMISQGKIHPGSFWSMVLHKKFVSAEHISNYTMCLVSIISAMNSALRLNFSSSLHDLDRRCYVIIAYVTISFFYMWGLSEIYRHVTRNHFCENSMIKLKKNADSMIRCRQLPNEMSKKVYNYYESKYVRMDVIEQQNIFYATMPQILKHEGAMACYRRYVKRVPFFSEWPAQVLEALVLMLTRETYLCNDMVAEPGVQSEGLAIVAAGELAVYSGQQERGHLIDGDFFGELSLVTDRELRTSSVFAITTTVILLLEKIPFRKFMRSYPNLFSELQTHLHNKFSKVT